MCPGPYQTSRSAAQSPFSVHACQTRRQIQFPERRPIGTYFMDPEFRTSPRRTTTWGSALVRLGHCEAALASYDAAIGLRPDYDEALHNRGIALQSLGRHERPRPAPTPRSRSSRTTSRRTTTWRRLRLDRDEEAMASDDQAIALDPEYDEAFTNRGVALQRSTGTRRRWPAMTRRSRCARTTPRRSRIAAWCARGSIGTRRRWPASNSLALSPTMRRPISAGACVCCSRGPARRLARVRVAVEDAAVQRVAWLQPAAQARWRAARRQEHPAARRAGNGRHPCSSGYAPPVARAGPRSCWRCRRRSRDAGEPCRRAPRSSRAARLCRRSTCTAR